MEILVVDILWTARSTASPGLVEHLLRYSCFGACGDLGEALRKLRADRSPGSSQIADAQSELRTGAEE